MAQYYFINHMPCKSSTVKSKQTEITKDQYDDLVRSIRNFDLIAPDGKYYRLELDGTWVLHDMPVMENVEEELTAEEALEIILGGAV